MNRLIIIAGFLFFILSCGEVNKNEHAITSEEIVEMDSNRAFYEGLKWMK